jgi:hypothetical protein
MPSILIRIVSFAMPEFGTQGVTRRSLFARTAGICTPLSPFGAEPAYQCWQETKVDWRASNPQRDFSIAVKSVVRDGCRGGHPDDQAARAGAERSFAFLLRPALAGPI